MASIFTCRRFGEDASILECAACRCARVLPHDVGGPTRTWYLGIEFVMPDRAAEFVQLHQHEDR